MGGHAPLKPTRHATMPGAGTLMVRAPTVAAIPALRGCATACCTENEDDYQKEEQYHQILRWFHGILNDSPNRSSIAPQYRN